MALMRMRGTQTIETGLARQDIEAESLEKQGVDICVNPAAPDNQPFCLLT